MEIFKSLKNKLIIITIVVVLGNFLFAKPVSATTIEGVLLQPVSDLLIVLGDSALDIMQKYFLTNQRVVIRANSAEERDGISAWTVLKYAGGALMVFAGLATIVGSWGIGTPAGIASIAGGIAVFARRRCSYLLWKYGYN